MPTFMLPVNIDNDPKLLSSLSWTYLGEKPDVIIDGIRYGFIESSSPIMEDVDGFDILFISMAVINQKTIENGELKQFGDIIFTLIDYSDIADYEYDSIRKALIESNFPEVDYQLAPPVKILSE